MKMMYQRLHIKGLFIWRWAGSVSRASSPRWDLIFLNPNLGGDLGVRFEVGEGGKLPLPPRLKLVTIMLEASNVARKYTTICSFRKYTF